MIPIDSTPLDAERSRQLGLPDYSEFVGVILPATPGGMLLTQFVGQGKEAAVFAFELLDEDADADFSSPYVTKISHTNPWLETAFLHYAVRIDVDRFPDHPFLRSPDDRLTRLRSEMLRRIFVDATIADFPVFDHLVERFLIATMYRLDFAQPEEELAAEFVEDRMLRPFFHADLPAAILRLSEEERFPADGYPRAVGLYRTAKHVLDGLRRKDTLGPFVLNPVYRLLVARSSDLISEDELSMLMADRAFVDRITFRHVEDIWWLAVNIYHCANSTREMLAKYAADESAERAEPIVPLADMQAFGLLLCRSVVDLAQRDLAGRHLCGLACYWAGKFHLLPDADIASAEAMFARAVALLDGPASKRDRHDMLLAFAQLIVDHKPESEHETARSFVMEALSIREQLT